MDPQSNATECFVDPTGLRHSIGDVLLRRCSIQDAIIKPKSFPSIDLLPAVPGMLLDEYFGHYNGIFPDTLRTKIQPIKEEYDYIFCDCPPNLGHFTKNALMASDFLIVPMEPEPLPLRGLQEFLRNILPDLQEHNPQLNPGGVVLVHRAPGSRKYLPERIRQEIIALNPRLLFEQEIRLDQQLALMAENNAPVCEYSPDSNGARDYLGLSIEFESRIPP
jgi:cellulose biosynthesis protein BcsQ